MATIAVWPIAAPLASRTVKRLAEERRAQKRCALAWRLKELEEAPARELTFPEFHQLRLNLDWEQKAVLMRGLKRLGFTVSGVLSEDDRVTRMSIGIANALCQPIALTGRSVGEHCVGPLEAQDEVWDFVTSPESWRTLCGLAGYALVRNGVVTDFRSIIES